MATSTNQEPTLDEDGIRALAMYRKLRAVMGRPEQVRAAVRDTSVVAQRVPADAVAIIFEVNGALHRVAIKNGSTAAGALAKAGVARGDAMKNIWFVDEDGHPLASTPPLEF